MGNLNLTRHSLIILSVATLFLALSGFDCASTEMTTAKVALQRKDYSKATEALRKEVAARPQNGDAWLMLSEIYLLQGQYRDMIDAQEKAKAATTPAITKAQRDNTFITRYNEGLLQYEKARVLYNDKRNLERALAHLDTADFLIPANYDNQNLRALIYAALDNDAKVAETYNRYIDMMNSDVEQGLKAGLTLGLTQSQVEAKLGAPSRSGMTDTAGGFTFYAPNQLYVYYTVPEPGQRPVVEGWKYFRDNSVPEALKERPVVIRSSPYVFMGLRAYRDAERDKKQYDVALPYLQTLSRLDPTREGVGTVVADIYVATGRVDEAKRLLQQEITANPSEPANYVSLGNLLSRANDFNGSVQAFKKVLDMNLAKTDNTYQTALFNLGAVYKNWGSHIQDSLKKSSKTNLTQAQIEQYQKPLVESVRYFEMLKVLKQNDLPLMTELANLYDVLGEKPKLTKIVGELEGQEAQHADNAQYWRAMSRLYLILGDNKKAEAADKKATGLGG